MSRPAATTASLATALLLSLSLALSSAEARASCTDLTKASLASSSTIRLEADSKLPARALSKAIELWQQCSNYGTGFPSFVTAEPGSRTISIEYRSREIGRYKCGSFSANKVTLYALAMTPEGSIQRCDSIAMNLAHELGHVLGLSDAEQAPACQRHVMSRINPNNRFSRSVSVEECQAAGQRWLTQAEWARVSEHRRSRLTGFVVAGGT